MSEPTSHSSPDLSQYIPKPVQWFKSEFDYSGKASIRSQNNLLVEGFATIELDGRYRPKIHFRYDSKTFDLNSMRDAVSDLLVTIECTSGVLTAEGLRWDYFITPPYCPEGNIIIHPLYVKLTSHAKGEAKHWVLPLLNFISKSGRKINEEDPLNHHPLRIFSPWSSARGLDYYSRVHLDELSRHARTVIAFSFHDMQCFIERLPDYEESVETIRESSRRQFAITALMVGSTRIDLDLTDVQLLMNRGPIRFEDWLFFATGSSVIVPWIEFRDDSAELISRIHFRRTVKNYTNGKDIVSDIGELLTSAAKSDKFNDVVTKAVLNRIAVAGQSDLFIEDRKINLFVAADSLTRNIRNQKETSVLGEAVTESLVQILEQTEQRILAISNPNQSELEALKRVANRVRDGAKSRSYTDATALMELARKHGLNDIHVIDQKLWKKKFTKYRGKVIHEGYFDPVVDDSLDDLADFMHYLQDLLTRIILKSIGYPAYYHLPTARRHGVTKGVDWVTLDTSPELLGF